MIKVYAMLAKTLLSYIDENIASIDTEAFIYVICLDNIHGEVMTKHFFLLSLIDILRERNFP